jgi:hypothetical protein
MSWWISSQDQKTGRRYVWSVGGGDLMLPMVVIALFVALFAPAIIRDPRSPVAIALWILLGGFLCLTVAKVSLFRQGIWRSWGSQMMTQGYARLYKVAYVLLAIGLFYSLL